MAMGRRTVNSLGALGVAVILGGAYFGVAAPIIASKNSVSVELQQAESLSSSYESKLTSFKNGESEEAKSAKATMALFDGLVPTSINIESASRAIAASLPQGVTLDSFDFKPAQQVASLDAPALTIDAFVAPKEFTADTTAVAPAAAAPEGKKEQDTAAAATGTDTGSTAAASTGAVDPNAPISGFERIPFTITVSADDYSSLSEYLNSLSDQPRLMSVVSVDSTRSEKVSATIYAFAFAGR